MDAGNRIEVVDQSCHSLVDMGQRCSSANHKVKDGSQCDVVFRRSLHASLTNSATRHSMSWLCAGYAPTRMRGFEGFRPAGHQLEPQPVRRRRDCFKGTDGYRCKRLSGTAITDPTMQVDHKYKIVSSREEGRYTGYEVCSGS